MAEGLEGERNENHFWESWDTKGCENLHWYREVLRSGKKHEDGDSHTFT